MKHRNCIKGASLALLVTALGFAATPPAHAKDDGISGYSGETRDCTQCHGGGQRPQVDLLGPKALPPGYTGTYFLKIAGGQQVEGSLDVSVSGGTLATTESGTKIKNGEVVHSRPRGVDGNGEVIFSFEYTAPASLGSETMWGAGLSSDGTGSTNRAGTDTDRLAIEVRELEVVAPGGTVSLKTFGGAPFQLVLLAVVDVSGLPLYQPVALGGFDAFGEFTISGPAPPEVSGLSITFESIGFGQISSKAVRTNREVVQFQ